MLMLNGALKDFNFAARLKGGQNYSTQFLLTPDPNVTYSACLMHKAEPDVPDGRGAVPGGAYAAHQRHAGGLPDVESCRTTARLETPHLQVVYKPPRESQFPTA